jgi:hypothetical protein
MTSELCIGNYVAFDGFVNWVNGIFETFTTYNDKTIIWIMFQNLIIETITKENCNHYHNNNIKWTPIEPIIKNIRVVKTQSFIITNI